jgi:hypothetical protein
MRIILFAAAIVSVFAQESAFQSGDGRTSIYLQSGSAAIINLTDTKFAFGTFHRTSTTPWFVGFDLFGKASSGITTLVDKKIKVPEGGADFTVGRHQLLSGGALSTSKVVDDWILVDIGYSRSYFYLQSTPGATTDTKRFFDRYRLIADYNALFPISKVNVLVGIAAGAERRNNLDDLTQVTFETAVVPTPAGSATSVQKTQGGFYGPYRQYVAAPIYTDILLIPTTFPDVLGSRLGIDVFTRSNLAKFNRYAEPGVGLFLTKKDAPTKVYGGLSASWNDGKIGVALVAGYNFQ